MAGPSSATSSKKRKTSDEQNKPKKAPRRQATRSKHEKAETFNLKQEAVIDLTGGDDVVAAKTPTKGKKSGKATQPSPKKGEEKRLKRYRAQAPLSMTAYHDRAANQRFFALNRERTINHDCPHGTSDCPMEVIDLAGSTGNVYQITIEHVPTCTCPNFTKGNAQCKHIIYVLNTVLKAPAHLSYQLAFLTSELREIFEHAGPLPIEKADQSDKDGKRKPIEGDCPICCCDLEEEDEEIVWCKAACGNNLHKSCFDRWQVSRRGAEVTCPFCRTPWMKDSTGNLQELVKSGKIGADGYVNVAQELGLSGQRDYSTYHSHWVRRQLGYDY
ncbi:hypothetical protein MBLNU457_g0376t3 [Dothideomycetes sp. NU457]